MHFYEHFWNDSFKMNCNTIWITLHFSIAMLIIQLLDLMRLQLVSKIDEVWTVAEIK